MYNTYTDYIYSNVGMLYIDLVFHVASCLTVCWKISLNVFNERSQTPCDDILMLIN